MQRRNFIKVLAGSAVAWPLASRAQQSAYAGDTGFLRSTSLANSTQFVTTFRQGLKEAGFFALHMSAYDPEQTVRLNRRIFSRDFEVATLSP